MKENIKLVAFDLDGTLTQHKSPLDENNRRVLDALAKHYRLLMLGAGDCMRIFHQMGQYPIDIIGNYGMQTSRYDKASGTLVQVDSFIVPANRQSVSERIARLRIAFGFCEFAGESVEFHDSGVVTFPILGTKAKIVDKLAFDPDRKKRRPIFPIVQEAFPEFTVFIGGSSSFDMAPAPYKKSYALLQYCKKYGIDIHQVAYCGDDYLPGGNDEDVAHCGVDFYPVDDYRTFENCVTDLL